MSNKNFVLATALVVAFISANSVQAMTLADLAKLNSEAIQTEAEIALAKKKDELAKLKPVVVPTQNTLPEPPKKKEKDPHFEIEGMVVKAIFGDITNQKARMEINGATITRRRGENIYSWKVTRITGDFVVLTHEGKTAKDTIEQVVYLTGVGQQLAVGRDALRPAASTQPGPIAPIAVVPAPSR